MTIRRCFVLFVSIALVTAFVPRSAEVYRTLHRATTNYRPTSHVANPLEDLWQNILDAFPAVLSPPKELDAAKIVRNPPKFIHAGTTSMFRKAHKQESWWKTKDVFDAFAAKYIGTSASSLTEDRLFQLLDNLDNMELLDQLEDYMPKSSIEIAEKFVADAVIAAASPMDKPLDRSKIHPDTHRFVKPVFLSKLKRILSKDPEYFRH